ncbi:S1 family peptidase [Streptomyces sp. TR06-5]|uniref:S1 family peptidase n=1 Tax=Streptomyces sp. TR06-5 TaxID=3385976 RepID=UPI0039A37293
MKVSNSASARVKSRSKSIAVAATGLVAAAALTAPGASAAPADAPTTSEARMAAAQDASGLAKKLGDARTGGAYMGDSGKMVVTITDQADASTVRKSGAVPKLVEHSQAEFGQAAKALENKANIKGTAWSVDPTSNTLSVQADSTVDAKEMAKLHKVTKRFGDAVTIERTSGEFSKLVQGGDAMYTSSWRCSAGFNAYLNGTYYIITAGHCTEGYPDWQNIGPTAASSFPGDDYGVIRNDYSSTPGVVNLYNGSTRDITGVGNAYVGQYVQRSGSTTGLHSGYVTGLNATVNYGGGDVVYGMIQTNVCAEPGDSGGSMFAGNTAIGMTSGGSGNCSSGGTTFFQPVTEVTNTYGLQVY